MRVQQAELQRLREEREAQQPVRRRTACMCIVQLAASHQILVTALPNRHNQLATVPANPNCLGDLRHACCGGCAASCLKLLK